MSPRRFCLRTYMISASGRSAFTLKGGDECVFGINDDVLRFALQLQSDGELQWEILLVRFTVPWWS